jgi:raffinose/stachyose/melibiose transport system permease protein
MDRKANKNGKLLRFVIISIIAILTLIPILYIMFSSFKTSEDINRTFSFLTPLNFKNYKNVFENNYAMFSFVNSIIITTASLIIDIVICSFAAYPLSRRKGKLYSFLFLFFLSAMMIPVATNLVPLYVIMNKLHLIDNRLSVIIISVANGIPMGILLYTGFIKTVPKELDESAIIDGCNYFQRFWRVIFPLLKPVTVAYALISAISIWNDFLIPMLFLRSQSKKTITLAVYAFSSSHASDWGAIYAMLTIAILPLIILFIFTQKYFYKGITAGAVKG